MKCLSANLALLLCLIPAGVFAQNSQPGDQPPAAAQSPDNGQQPQPENTQQQPYYNAPQEPAQPQAPVQNQENDSGRRRFDLPPGITPRTDASAYPASRALPQFTIGAQLLTAKEVEQKFSTPLGKHYLVVEVGVYPAPSQSADLQTGYFTLRSVGKDEQALIALTPQEVVSALNSQRARPRNVVLFPGMIAIGPGARGMGGNQGGNPQVMEKELRDKSLPEGTLAQPSAGFLYFPISGKRAAHYNLELTRNGQTESLSLPEPKK
jgi:hypothetical protein